MVVLSLEARRRGIPAPRRLAFEKDSSDDESLDTFLDAGSESEEDGACWALDSLRLFREQDAEPPAELGKAPVNLKVVDLDTMMGYEVGPDPRMGYEVTTLKEDDAEDARKDAALENEWRRAWRLYRDATTGDPYLVNEALGEVRRTSEATVRAYPILK